MQAWNSSGVSDHILVRPRAQRPQSGLSQHKLSRDLAARSVPARHARCFTPQNHEEGRSALPRTSGEQPQARAVSQPPSHAEASNFLSGPGPSHSPEVLAAAQALLHSQLQQAGVKPEHLPPQLNGLLNSLDPRHSTDKLPQPSDFTSAAKHRSESPFCRANSQSHHHPPLLSVTVDGNHDRGLSEARLSRANSNRGVEAACRRHEGGFAAEQTHELSRPRPLSHDTLRLYSNGAGQYSMQAQAQATYAQHLFGFLAAQAQVC